MADDAASLGKTLALVVGLGAVAGAGAVAVATREPIPTLILALVGGSALSGYLKTRRSSR